MGIIVDIGKTRVKEILTSAYQFALEETRLKSFGIDNQDVYPRSITVRFISKKDKLDWTILEDISNEFSWFSAQKKYMSLGFETPDFKGRNDMEIFLNNKIAFKLSQLGLQCYHQSYSRD